MADVEAEAPASTRAEKVVLIFLHLLFDFMKYNVYFYSRLIKRINIIAGH
jgi:hypothetical protein